MIRIRPSNKKDLLDIVGGQLDGRRDAVNVDPARWLPDRQAEFQLIWPDGADDTCLPSAVIIEPGTQREFLAWASTFVGHLRPFTAYFRVFDLATFRLLQGLSSRPKLQELASPALALIFAENFLAAEVGATNSLAACRTTYSYAAGRCLALGGGGAYRAVLTDGWNRVQRILPSARPISDFDALALTWNTLDCLAGTPSPNSLGQTLEPSPATVNACEEILKTGEISSATWARVCGSPKLVDIADKMTGTRERRVLEFEAVAKQLREASDSTPAERAFACGFVASRIAVGSLEHFGLVRPLASIFPGVTYWYALCAGLQPHSEIPHHHRGLGFRLLRDLVAPGSWESAPRADISASELEMLRGADTQDEFATSVPGVIEVEVAPLVTTIIRPAASRAATTQHELFQSERREESEALRRLGDAIEQAQYYYRRLSGSSGRSPQDRPDKRRR